MGCGGKGRFRRICVFCGSRSGNNPSFGEAAIDLGKQLVRPLSHPSAMNNNSTENNENFLRWEFCCLYICLYLCELVTSQEMLWRLESRLISLSCEEWLHGSSSSLLQQYMIPFSFRSLVSCVVPCATILFAGALSPFQVERKIDLVYGGGSVGLMGLISKTVLDGGCHVLGWDSQSTYHHHRWKSFAF